MPSASRAWSDPVSWVRPAESPRPWAAGASAIRESSSGSVYDAVTRAAAPGTAGGAFCAPPSCGDAPLGLPRLVPPDESAIAALQVQLRLSSRPCPGHTFAKKDGNPKGNPNPNPKLHVTSITAKCGLARKSRTKGAHFPPNPQTRGRGCAGGVRGRVGTQAHRGWCWG